MSDIIENKNEDINEEKPKKRGRPPKKTGLNNEETEAIRMTENKERDIKVEDLQKKWQEIFRQHGTSFSGLSNMRMAATNAMLNNPFIQNTRIKQTSATPDSMDKQNLIAALETPSESEAILKKQSMYLFFQNYVYNNLLRLNREIPEYKWYIIPQFISKSEMDEKFKEESFFVEKVIKKFNPPLALKTINMQVQQEGKCSYLVRKSFDKKKQSVDFFLLQKLNPEAVKLTAIGSKQQFIASFNMVLFLNPAYDVNQFPPYIGKLWEQMKSSGIIKQGKKNGNLEFNPQKGVLDKKHSVEIAGNNYAYWVQLEQEDCWTFGQDLSTPVSVPETMGLFLDLKELADYKWLMGSLMSKSVNSVLTASVPLKKDAEAGQDSTLLSTDLITYYDTIFFNNVTNTVLSFFAPFTDFKLHTIDTEPDNMNIVFNRLRDLIATSGNSALLSISDKPSISTTKTSQTIAASRASYLTSQFQSFLNTIINEQFGLEYEFRVILWSDIFDKDKIKLAKELLLQGKMGFLPIVLSSFDQTINDYKAMEDYMNIIGITSEDTIRENQNDKKDIKNPVGRNLLEEDEIENDSTADSRDGGDNLSELKEFSS